MQILCMKSFVDFPQQWISYPLLYSQKGKSQQVQKFESPEFIKDLNALQNCQIFSSYQIK